MRSRLTPAVWTLILSVALAGLAAAFTYGAPDSPMVVEHLPLPVLAVGVGAMFWWAEQFLMNIEFRRQAHSLTLAGVPLLLGVLVLPPAVFVLTRVVGSLIAFLFQRTTVQKNIYNTSAYAFEAALDALLLHLLLGQSHGVNWLLGVTAIVVLAVVDQVMCCFVLLLIRLHNGPLSRADVTEVLIPAAALSVVATIFGFAALMLVRQGAFGVVVVLVLASVGTFGYIGHAKTRRQHQSLSLVHEFVTLGVGASSIDMLADQLLCRIRRLLRAESATVTLLEDRRLETTRALVMSVDEDDEVSIRHRTVDPSDWVMVRALTDEEPMLAERGTKDPAVTRWLRARGLRDAVLVAFPRSTGLIGTVSATNRLGEIASFDSDDLTLLQTLTGHLAVAIRSTRLVEQLGYDATHDALTGLYNRVYLTHRIDAVLADPQTSAAVLLLDLDRFKEVNDALGHEVGDRLLLVVAQRLRDCVPVDATVARLGGDEFAVLLPEVAGRDDVRATADRIACRLSAPVAFDEAMLSPGASIGVALSSPAARETELLRQADTAMYEAKTADGSVAIYDADMDRGRVERLALLADLRSALNQHAEQFTLHYQPKMDLETGAITSVEALVRWNHPTLGTVSPDRFIPLAETTGLISVLAPLVLEAALTDCARWLRAGLDMAVAVNLSARNINDRELPRRVSEALARVGVPASKLILEITESSVMGDPEQTLPILNELNELGACLSLDDFGTGYSSLSYLQRLPVRELKIDQSFVRGLGGENDASSEALIRSITSLGANLDLRVVAEGIEDVATIAGLKRLGCHVGQGFGISRPLPMRELVLWVRGRQNSGGLSLVQALG
ncbi:MAG TPA: EAL domain-containing protein [Jatrophihabitantaceae bacterium]|jgi:diguanylate cyclase (GGDEF)-like protein